MAIVWRFRANIIRTALCWIVWYSVQSQQHSYMSSSYRSNRFSLSHWNPYAGNQPPVPYCLTTECWYCFCDWLVPLVSDGQIQIMIRFKSWLCHVCWFDLSTADLILKRVILISIDLVWFVMWANHKFQNFDTNLANELTTSSYNNCLWCDGPFELNFLNWCLLLIISSSILIC